MRISDWSSDVCSSDLLDHRRNEGRRVVRFHPFARFPAPGVELLRQDIVPARDIRDVRPRRHTLGDDPGLRFRRPLPTLATRRDHLHRASTTVPVAFEATFERSEEHTSELQSLMRISYAVFCLKKKK